MKNIMIIMLSAVLVLAFCSSGFAATLATKAIDVKAIVPSVAGAFDVKINKVAVTDCTGQHDTSWTPVTSMMMNFGTLVADTTNHIFTTGIPGFYYAVDVGVLDNTHTTWTISHAVTTPLNGTVAGSNLNYNVNVGFDRIIAGTGGAADVDTNIVKHAFQSSNGVSITKDQLKDGAKQGWLRIYYGIASGLQAGMDNPGNCTVDASDALPIPLTQPAGTYQGKVTLTLSA